MEVPADTHKAAIVLAGGGARGAYEAGVIRYLRDEVPGGAEFHLPIVCGTSVGAIHAVFLAATADRPRDGARDLTEVWQQMRLGDVFHLGVRELLSAKSRLGGAPDPRHPPLARGGLVDARPLEKLVRERIPWKNLRANIASGIVQGLTVSATQVATGRTVVFVDRHGGGLPAWTRDPHVVAHPTHIGLAHTLASACIPFMFPAILVGGEYYCDGGLRQNTPLSPALRLGADRVLVIGAKHRRRAENHDREPGRVAEFPSPLFLAGKVLNAFLLDRIDYDLERLEGYNALMDSLDQTCGPDVRARVREQFGRLRGQPYRRVQALHIRPSRNIGGMAADVAASPEFGDRAHSLAARLTRRLAKSQLSREADFLSYFLFDGGFTGKLVEMGYEDARGRHDDLSRFVAGEPLRATLTPPPSALGAASS
jgi:NTE family protein